MAGLILIAGLAAGAWAFAKCYKAADAVLWAYGTREGRQAVRDLQDGRTASAPLAEVRVPGTSGHRPRAPYPHRRY